MNLVVGATGFLGSEICRLLAAQGKPVRAMVRPTADAAQVEQLRGLGAELVQEDLRDPASLATACRGATAVFSTASACPRCYEPGNTVQGVDLDGVTNLIAAARTAGVPRFIYTSFSGQLEGDYPLRNAKRAVEQPLRDSGLTYTILRPSFYMESWLSPALRFDAANANVAICGSGQNPISWISLHHVAQFAVASLDNPAARNATLQLGGPQAVTSLQVVGIFEKIAGRPFAVQHVSEEALAAQMAAATDDLAKTFPGLMLCNARGDAIDMRATLEAFPLKLTTVEEYAQRVLG